MDAVSAKLKTDKIIKESLEWVLKEIDLAVNDGKYEVELNKELKDQQMSMLREDLKYQVSYNKYANVTTISWRLEAPKNIQ